jgi:hypothetical protein
MKKQSAGELSRTIAGQWTKTEKRAAASRSIVEANKQTHKILKDFRKQQAGYST